MPAAKAVTKQTDKENGTFPLLSVQLLIVLFLSSCSSSHYSQSHATPLIIPFRAPRCPLVPFLVNSLFVSLAYVTCSTPIRSDRLRFLPAIALTLLRLRTDARELIVLFSIADITV